MAEYISQFFIDVETIPEGFAGFVQLLFLGACYAAVLFQGSQMISDGSELLLLVPSLEGIVGSIVLPILGAVPDGAMVLFSGLGPDAQQQLDVGIGALAGSTIMLLTLPWFLAVYAGRVTLDADGKGRYQKKKAARLVPETQHSLFGTGINCLPRVADGGKIMMLTALGYLVIQGPAFALHCGYVHEEHCHPEGEKWWAFGGFLLCAFSFCSYMLYKWRTADSPSSTDAVDRVKREQVESSLIPLTVAYADQIRLIADGKANDPEIGDQSRRLKGPLRQYFNKYDADASGTIDRVELARLLDDINEPLSAPEITELMQTLDSNNDGSITFDEFFENIPKLFLWREKRHQHDEAVINADEDDDGDDGDDDDEEEEDITDGPEFQNLTREQILHKIKMRSFTTMAGGVFLVLLFSDPMVDVMASLGKRLGVSAFYVSFVLAPLASNASELLASYNYAMKKTVTTVTISLETLQGAACMNNTFCLGIFLALIFFRGLSWEFSAETVSIIFTEFAIALISLKTTHTLFDGLLVLSLYPVSLVVVYALEASGLN